MSATIPSFLRSTHRLTMNAPKQWNHPVKHSQVISRFPFITLLIFLVAAWPLSYLGGWQDAIGVKLEEFPRGWTFRFVPGVGYMGHGYTFIMSRGQFFAYSQGSAPNPKPPRPGPFLSQDGLDASHWFGGLRGGIGFGIINEGSLYNSKWMSRTGLMFPLWPLSLLSGIWLALLFRRWIMSRRIAIAGLCPTCSYDLRAHKPGDKCPECGTPIPAIQSPFS